MKCSIKPDVKKEILNALDEFSLALEECEKVLLMPEVIPDQVALCLSLMSAGLLQVKTRINSEL